jgi:tRNA A-37 threonylcarbamoyl transferase component Bud32
VAEAPEGGSETWAKRKKALIVEAVDLSAGDREAFLREQCPDPVLRAEVNSVLRAYDAAVQFPDDRPQLTDLDTSDDMPFGSYVGQYVVVDRLDSGGQGELFLGNDPLLHRKVALKRLRASNLESAEEWARILREAQAAGRISHPNVATIHNVIEHAMRAFIVMEYVEGENLAVRLRRERLSMPRVLELGQQLASAIGAAHAKGVVHRDLKPKNIQLTLEGSAKVLDFGVASASPARTLTTIPDGEGTLPGQTLTIRGGTPGYMSPEQMRGEKVDERSDIFSLGLVLHEMATGRRLYPSTDLTELAVDLSRPAPRADAVDPGVPRGLADVIARALELDPNRRFQSARDMELELQALAAAFSPRPLSLAMICAFWLFATFITLTLAGAATSFVYSNGLAMKDIGSTQSSPWWWPYWGFRSMFLPVGVMVQWTVGFALLGGAARLALATSAPLRRWYDGKRAMLEPLRSAPSTTWAQLLLLANATTLVFLWWRFAGVIDDGIGHLLMQSGPLSVLAPSMTSEHRTFRYLLSLELFVFGVAWYRLLKARYSRRERGGVAVLAGGIAAAGATVVLLAAPYRILYQSNAERVSYKSQRCYIVVERQKEAVVFCPVQDPPWASVVKFDDPDFSRPQQKINEDVFVALDAPR